MKALSQHTPGGAGVTLGLLTEMQFWWRLTIQVRCIEKILLIPSPTLSSAYLCLTHFARDLRAFQNDDGMICDYCFETIHIIGKGWIYSMLKEMA